MSLDELLNRDNMLKKTEIKKPKPKKQSKPKKENKPKKSKPKKIKPKEIPEEIELKSVTQIAKEQKVIEEQKVMETQNRMMKITMSMQRKVNLGNYESMDFFLSSSIDLPIADHIDSIFLIKEKMHKEYMITYEALSKALKEVVDKEIKKE